MSDRVLAPTRAAILVLGVLAGITGNAFAEELVAASVRESDGTELEFRMTGNSREDPIGGEISLGDAVYRISRISRHGLVGAWRYERGSDGRIGEFVVFSSSYGAQTAVGTPWVAAREVRHCDEPYNTFLAVYRVEGEAAIDALGPIPYPKLVEDIERSQHSRVYCFTGRAGGP